MALPARNHDEPSLASLIERSAELKHALVAFALSPRFERQMERFVLESGSDQIPDEGDAIDRFALQHTLPNGKTVLDQFLASRPDLTAADREMLRGWRDPVEGIFEIRRKDRDSLVLLHLLDDLEYRTYSNIGPAPFRPLPKHGFVHARLIPIRPVPDAWLASGSMRAYRKSAAADVAQAALELATKLPELVYRNPDKIEQAWKQMREDRAAFVEFFGNARGRPDNAVSSAGRGNTGAQLDCVHAQRGRPSPRRGTACCPGDRPGRPQRPRIRG